MAQQAPHHRNVDLMPGSFISNFRVLERIGSGGMGVVYKAEDLKLQSGPEVLAGISGP